MKKEKDVLKKKKKKEASHTEINNK